MRFGAARVSRRLIALGLALLTGSGSAAELETLREALDRADWPVAEAALAAIEGQPAVDSLEVLFLSGMMAAARGDFGRAETAFRRLLEVRPELPRPRLELARVLYLQGDDEAARREFESLLASGLPAPVADKVRAFLDAIGQRSAWSVELTLAPVIDDNVNGGTSRDTVNLGGLSFNVNPDAKAVRGEGLVSGIRVRKLAPAGGLWRHELSGGLTYKNYRQDAYDDTYTRLAYGLRRLAAPVGGESGGGVFASQRRIGDAPFSRSHGLRFDTRWPLGPAVQLEAVFERQWVDYHANPQRDGPLSWLGLTAQFGLDALSLAVLSLDRLREQAADPGFRLTSYGFGLAYYRDFPGAITLGPNGRLGRTSHDQAAPLFGQRRRDKDRSLGIYLAKKDWLLFGLHPSLSFSREWRESSIDFFSHRRNRWQLSFERRY